MEHLEAASPSNLTYLWTWPLREPESIVSLFFDKSKRLFSTNSDSPLSDRSVELLQKQQWDRVTLVSHPLFHTSIKKKENFLEIERNDLNKGEAHARLRTLLTNDIFNNFYNYLLLRECFFAAGGEFTQHALPSELETLLKNSSEFYDKFHAWKFFVTEMSPVAPPEAPMDLPQMQNTLEEVETNIRLSQQALQQILLAKAAVDAASNVARTYLKREFSISSTKLLPVLDCFWNHVEKLRLTLNQFEKLSTLSSKKDQDRMAFREYLYNAIRQTQHSESKSEVRNATDKQREAVTNYYETSAKRNEARNDAQEVLAIHEKVVQIQEELNQKISACHLETLDDLVKTKHLTNMQKRLKTFCIHIKSLPPAKQLQGMEQVRKIDMTQDNASAQIDQIESAIFN